MLVASKSIQLLRILTPSKHLSPYTLDLGRCSRRFSTAPASLTIFKMTSGSTNTGVGGVKKEAHNISTQELELKDAKWVTLNVIEYEDQEGTRRRWEVASRKTTTSGGIDAVDIIPVLRPKADNEPISTIIIEQYRPPTANITVEFPAGLIDKDETPETTAIRELEEETGFKASGVLGCSPLLWSDPGMTTATMKTVILDVPVASIHGHLPPQHLDVGEHITRRIVPLNDLKQVLSVYGARGAAIDAKLSHFADGWELFRSVNTGHCDAKTGIEVE